MKRDRMILIVTGLILTILTSCHSDRSNRAVNEDTALKTSADTTIIPGSPGPTGTHPRPSDTTKAHRDSIKKAVHISDTSAGNSLSPN